MGTAIEGGLLELSEGEDISSEDQDKCNSVKDGKKNLRKSRFI